MTTPLDLLIELGPHISDETGKRMHARLMELMKEPTHEMLQALFVLPDMVQGHIIRHSIDKLPAAFRAMMEAPVE